jgi:hypothetical protein
MRGSLDYRDGLLCVLIENGIEPKKWFPIHPTEEVEARALMGRPVTVTDSEEGIYVDEEGNVFQLLNKGETKPIEIEHLPGGEETEREQLNASSNEKKPHGQNGDSKRVQRKNRNNGRERQALPTSGPGLELLRPKTTAASQPSATSGTAAEAPVQLSLRQKLAEVRRRIGYVQKRGHNERFNYSYVTAADIAGPVGDILADPWGCCHPQP